MLTSHIRMYAHSKYRTHTPHNASIWASTTMTTSTTMTAVIMQKFKTSKIASPTNIISRRDRVADLVVGMQYLFRLWYKWSRTWIHQLHSDTFPIDDDDDCCCVVFFELIDFLLYNLNRMCKRFNWQVFYRLLANVKLPILMLLFSYHACHHPTPPQSLLHTFHISCISLPSVWRSVVFHECGMRRGQGGGDFPSIYTQ